MIFFLIAIVIFTSMYGFIGWRIIVPASLVPPWNMIAWGILIVFMLLPPVSIAFRVYGIDNTLSNILAWIGYMSLGFFLLVFSLIVMRDLVWFGALIVQKSFLLVRALLTNTGTVELLNLERRRFLVNSVNLSILGISGALAGYGFFEARRRPAVVEIFVPVDDLPDDLEGFRIVQITDIHVSSTINRSYVQAIVDQANNAEPDVIVFTGDLADDTVPHLRDNVAPLSQLSAPYGCYFVTGNHEYYSGVEAWIEEVKRLGFTVLLNEHRILQRGEGSILLAGVTDHEAGRTLQQHASSPEASLNGASPNHVKVLLAHQPRSIYSASKLGFDLQISGHTHGGQFFPWHFVVGLQQPYISGLHRHDNTWIYVSRGAGYWGPPLRIGSRSEIAVIILTAAKNPSNSE
ncbi:hypothetical protein AMJ80_11360 [bacterium SM23_31]|nr:MAG: hypothetical protein AMJ80_11360 [bacterium SM23_31]